MPRPPSIITFERLYLGSWIIGLVNTILAWPAQRALLARDPNFASNPAAAQMMAWMMPVGLVVGTLVVLLLWYFAARRGAVVAKWIIVLFAVLGIVSVIRALAGLAHGEASVTTVVGLLCSALSIAAAVMLFRPDAKVWFGETVDPIAPVEPLR